MTMIIAEVCLDLATHLLALRRLASNGFRRGRKRMQAVA